MSLVAMVGFKCEFQSSYYSGGSLMLLDERERQQVKSVLHRRKHFIVIKFQENSLSEFSCVFVRLCVCALEIIIISFHNYGRSMHNDDFCHSH